MIQDLCSKAKRQFQKILSCVEDRYLEKSGKYAKDGEEFFQRQERKFSGDREDTPEINNLSVPSDERDDFKYVEDFKTNNNSTMKSWEKCFHRGRQEGYSSIYTNLLTLKCAYHNHRSRNKKGNIDDITE